MVFIATNIEADIYLNKWVENSEIKLIEITVNLIRE